MGKYNVIVAHPAQQHSYRLATGLKKHGILYKYITTVYYKRNSLTYFASLLLKGKFKRKAQNRQCSYLLNNDVKQFCEGIGLLKLLALNVSIFRRWYYLFKYGTADLFAKKVAAYSIDKHVDAVITYDDSSPVLFEILQKKNPQIIKILDMSAANLHYMRKIYDIDTKLMPDFANRLHFEYAKVWNENIMDRASREIKASDYFLVPSQFVARSLKYSGVRDEQILLCPYGVDVEEFSCKEYKGTENHKSLNFIYVGGVKELKGISYLLKAFSEISRDQAKLTVVGAFNPNDEDIAPYLDKVNFTGMVLHSEVPNLLKNADVFVFPSLGEGLSLSTLEAAACGLPLIVSENSGVNDYMINGNEGFVIPIQSVEAIKNAVSWYINNPEKIETMGRNAREMAMRFTWDAYYEKAGKLIKEILDKNADSLTR